MDEGEKTPFLVSTKKVFDYVFLTVKEAGYLPQ
jgi:hypothetical protein